MASDLTVFEWPHGNSAVAVKVEGLKEEKYTDLLHSHEFVPVAVETAGVFGLQTMSFAVRELGKRLRHQTVEEKSTIYLIQCLSTSV